MKFVGSSRISDHAINEIFDRCKSVKSLNGLERGLVVVTDSDSEQYILKITANGVFAGYITESA